MARLVTGRDKVLSTYRSYHGNTGAAVVATGDWRRVPNEFARGHAHFFGPFLYRTEFWATTPEQESERALHHLERVIQSEGANSIAAIILEGIPGTAGVLVPPPGYLDGRARALRQARHPAHPRRGHVGLRPHRRLVRLAERGREPGWRGARPDHLRQGRELGLRARRRRHHVGVDRATRSRTRSSRAGSPTPATRSRWPRSSPSIDAMDRREDPRERDPHRRATCSGPGLEALAKKHPMIGEVRGLGVFWALDLVQDAEDARARRRRDRRGS